MDSPPAPEGFMPHFKTSPVTAPWEPLFSRCGVRNLEIGLWLREVHCNSRGFLHGGVIAALADNAMGLSCVARHTASGRADGEPQCGLRGERQAWAMAQDRAARDQGRGHAGLCRCADHR